MTFKYTEKQTEAIKLINRCKHTFLRGGSRSGKTFLFCRAIAIRALKAAGSRHVIFRKHFNHIKQTIGMDTFPKMLKITMPNIEVKLNKTDWVFTFSNGSEVWLAGLDDKERTEKILGSEYATIYYNEISQIDYNSTLMARTRLCQKVSTWDNKPLTLRFFYDCNPPSPKHWSHKVFIEGIDPIELKPVAKGHGTMLMNPTHNLENLSDDYIDELNTLPERHKKRFLHGEYTEDVEGALWTAEMIRFFNEAPPMKRIIVGVDPSGTITGDEVGIIGVGIGHNDHFYVLADRTKGCSPRAWATLSTTLLKTLKGDAIAAEKNFGGDMVKYTIQTVDANVRVIEVNASRGKDIRAEPVVSKYEDGLVHHAKGLHELEDEMLTWIPGQGKSPNRVDALVWAITELMNTPKKTTPASEAIKYF